MSRFIAAHTLPMSEAEFSKMLDQSIPQYPTGIAWNLTYCDFEDHKFFCEWDAPNKEALEKVFKTQGMPYDAIYPVRVFNTATKLMEP